MTSAARIVVRCLVAMGAGVFSLLIAAVLVAGLGRLGIYEIIVSYLRAHDWFALVALPLFLALMLFPFFVADVVFRGCMRVFDARIPHRPGPRNV